MGNTITIMKTRSWLIESVFEAADSRQRA